MTCSGQVELPLALTVLFSTFSKYVGIPEMISESVRSAFLIPHV